MRLREVIHDPYSAVLFEPKVDPLLFEETKTKKAPEKAQAYYDMHHFDDQIITDGDKGIDHIMDAAYNALLKGNHCTPKETEQVMNDLVKVKELHSKMMDMKGWKEIEEHKELMLAYLNEGGKNPSSAGYIEFLNKRLKSKLENVKSDTVKERITKQLKDELKNIASSRKVFDTMFKLHSHVKGVKDTLVKVVKKSPDAEKAMAQPALDKKALEKANKPKKKPEKEEKITPNDKMAWLKSMFPGKNLGMVGDGEHTFIAQLQHLHNTGVKDLTIVSGPERSKEFQNTISKYNGPGKLFNFSRVRVVTGEAQKLKKKKS